MNNINKLVRQIKQQIIKIETNKQTCNEDFNIFSILNMERKEVETHSAFIYELLNPYGRHNQKDLFLKLFIENVLGIKDYGKIIKSTKEDPTLENRRIDFVIETQKELIGIEMKIDADDQYEQLCSYKEELILRQKYKQNIQLYYLTLFGDYASSKSTNGLKVHQDYKVISFNDDIYSWLNLCIEKISHSIIIKEAIVQYKNLINILINKQNTKMENFMDKAINDVNDIKAMDIISDNYPLIWAKKEIEFWGIIEKNLIQELDDEYMITYLMNYFENEMLSYKKLNSIRIKTGKTREPFGIYLEKKIENTNYYLSISILYGQYNDKTIKIDFNIIHQVSQNEKNNKSIRNIKEKIKTSISTKINFYHSKNNDKLTFQLFDKKFLYEITTELTDEIVSYVKIIEKLSNDIYESII